MRPACRISLATLIAAHMFLSQAGTTTMASRKCAPATVSTESAIRSRDCREKRIPGVPFEMPSLTQGVPNW